MAKKNRSNKKFKLSGWMIALVLGVVAGYLAAAVLPSLVEEQGWFESSKPRYRKSSYSKVTVTPAPIVRPKPAPRAAEKPEVIPAPARPDSDYRIEDEPEGDPEVEPVGEPGVTMVIEEVLPVASAPLRRDYVDAPANPEVESAASRAPIQTGYVHKEPWVAVVLDDWGYNRNAVGWLSRLEGPVTLAVLPGLEYSRSIPREAHQLGHEVILHMPMEPKKGDVEEGALKPSMSDQQIRARLTECLNAIPYAVGVNNHMGSKMTEDARAMNTVLSTVYDRGMFFLDSFVTGDTVVRDLHKRRGMPVFERDVFLDNVREHGAILREFRRLKLIALKKGYAIGIGHDEPVTLQALAEIMPEWRKEGIRFVKLSELRERLIESRR